MRARVPGAIMRLYLEVARRTFARMNTYRAATAAGVFTNAVWGVLLASVLLAVYDERRTVGGFDAVDAVSFVFVAQGLLMVLGLFGDTEMADRITTGDVVVDLQRPHDHQLWWAAVAYGQAAHYLLARGVPIVLVGALGFGVRIPPDAGQASAFVLSLVLGVAVAFGWRYLLGLSAFWLLDIRGANQVGWMVAQFLGGAFVPIVFFPAWLESSARVLPFASMLEIPIEVWLGQLRGVEMATALLTQVAWALVLLVAGHHVLARAVRRVVVQGG